MRGQMSSTASLGRDSIASLTMKEYENCSACYMQCCERRPGEIWHEVCSRRWKGQGWLLITKAWTSRYVSVFVHALLHSSYIACCQPNVFISARPWDCRMDSKGWSGSFPSLPFPSLPFPFPFPSLLQAFHIILVYKPFDIFAHSITLPPSSLARVLLKCCLG
jgi:hypothetical protein